MARKNVGIAEFKICRAPEELEIVGLGSCIGVALYHEGSCTGALCHIMLPEGNRKEKAKPGKYAGAGIRAMYEKLRGEVGDGGRIVAKIAGGAQMFESTKGFEIGRKNVEAAKKELRRLGIKVVAEDTGASYGRTIVFKPKTGELRIKTIYGEKVI